MKIGNRGTFIYLYIIISTAIFVMFVLNFNKENNRLKDTINEMERVFLTYKSKLTEDLLFSISNNDKSRVEFLLKSGVEVNIKDENGNSPLWIASNNGYRGIIDILLDYGADIFLDYDKPFIERALYYDYIDLALKFINKKANVNAQTETSDTALHHTAWSGKYNIANLLIKNGADVNAKVQSGDYNSYTPLRYASEYGMIDIARLLIENGADVNAVDVYNKTILHYIPHYSYNEIDIARLLIENGADVNAVDIYGGTPMFYSELYRANAYTSLLRRNNAELFNFNDDNCESAGGKLLHLSIEFNNIELTKKILDNNNVNIAYKNNRGETALHYAAIYGRYDAAKSIIDIINKNNLPYVVDLVDNEGKTALHHSALYGRLSITRMLIESGADVNFINNYGKIPIHYVSFFNHPVTTQYLIDKGSCVNHIDNYNGTPLLYAEINKADDVIRVLKENNAILFPENINIFNNVRGKTPLHFCAERGNIEMAIFLIESGANVNITDSIGRAPLYFAVNSNNFEIAKFLIESGASINLRRTDNGRTPFHQAVINGQFDFVQLFLKKKSNPNVVDDLGNTPLHYSVKYGHKYISLLLINSNSKIYIKNNEGKTPLGLSIDKGDTKLIELMHPDIYKY